MTRLGGQREISWQLFEKRSGNGLIFFAYWSCVAGVVMKYLFWLLVLLAVWWLWRKRQDTPAASAPAESSPVDMRICAHCGVHFPENDGVYANGQAYCCAAHRQLAASQ